MAGQRRKLTKSGKKDKKFCWAIKREELRKKKETAFRLEKREVIFHNIPRKRSWRRRVRAQEMRYTTWGEERGGGGRRRGTRNFLGPGGGGEKARLAKTWGLTMGLK